MANFDIFEATENIGKINHIDVKLLKFKSTKWLTPRLPYARRVLAVLRLGLQLPDARAQLAGEPVQLGDGDGGLVLALLERGHEALVHLEQEGARALISLHLVNDVLQALAPFL